MSKSTLSQNMKQQDYIWQQCGANTFANLLKTLGLPISKVYIFCNAVAHVVALHSSPSHFAPPYNRLYDEINSLSYKIGNLISQPKESILRFL